VGAVTTLWQPERHHDRHGQPRYRLGSPRMAHSARGLVGIRTDFMTETRGGGMMHTNFDGYEPWFGDIRLRQNGVLVADRRGPTTANALIDLESRGILFVAPGTEVYEGMIVGENSRSDEMN